MGFFESDSEKAEREHNEAQKEGFESNALERAAHAALSGLYSDAHNEGWDNGVKTSTDSWHGGHGKDED